MKIEQLKPKLAYSIKEVVAATGISRTAVYAALSSGQLKAKKRGTSTIILMEDLRQFLTGLPDYTQPEE